MTRSNLNTILLCALCGVGLLACRANEATPTPEPQLKPTVRPTATLPAQGDQPTQPTQSTQPPSQGGLVAYDDPTAPFSMQYPTGWKVREEPESILFQSPDQAASIQIIIYEYPEGAPRTTTAKEVFDKFTQTFAQGTGLKLSNTATRADGSVYADVAFQDLATRSALQGSVRVLLAKSRRYHFILLFAADASQLARYKAIATTASDSFRER